MNKVIEYIKTLARLEGKSSEEWKAVGAKEQAAYRAGSSNTCLEILDFIERNPDCLNKKAARKLAEEIATMLFTNGAGEVAERLVHEKPNGTLTGGGWVKACVEDRIEEILKGNLFWSLS